MTDFIEQHNELTYEFILSFQRHIDKLYDNLLEQNLSRIIEPFSRVEVSKVCSMNFKSPAESPKTNAAAVQFWAFRRNINLNACPKMKILTKQIGKRLILKAFTQGKR